jgi:hypothetical protein
MIECVANTIWVELESYERAQECAADLVLEIILSGGNMADSISSSGAQRPNPNEKLVRVFDTEQESEAMVVRGLLESAGIESDLTSLDAQQDILPGVGGTVILVREEDAAEAKKMIEEYRQTPDELETAEFALNEEPPAES